MLSAITTFFTDWVPSLAVVFAAGFGLYKWRKAERIRQEREIPSAAGALSASAVRTGDRVLVQLDALWRNTGKIPLSVDVGRTQVDVFEVPDDVGVGSVQIRRDPTELGRAAHTVKPWVRAKGVILEPATDSLVQTHFVLPADRLFVFRWKLYRKNDEGRKLSSTRFLTLNTATLEATSTPLDTTGSEEEE